MYPRLQNKCNVNSTDFKERGFFLLFSTVSSVCEIFTNNAPLLCQSLLCLMCVDVSPAQKQLSVVMFCVSVASVVHGLCQHFTSTTRVLCKKSPCCVCSVILWAEPTLVIRKKTEQVWYHLLHVNFGVLPVAFFNILFFVDS